MNQRLRVLSISTMFPNPRMPVHAQFVKQRLDALAKRVDLTVLSPVSWFPGETLVERYRNRHGIPAQVTDNAYPTFFPKFLSIPAVAKPLEGYTLAMRVHQWLRAENKLKSFDLIDCHLAFPEGFSGALLKRWLGLPLCVTLRGHDINDLPRYPVRIRQVLYALKNADRYFGVAQALVDGAVRLGAPAQTGFRSANGVDASRFFPLPKPEARQALGLPATGKILLSVSHLVVRKGVDILIKALADLHRKGYRDTTLVIVGKGGEEGNVEPQLRALAASLGVTDSVRFAGAVLNHELYRYYSAADLFCLASEKEGWPNVVLEALACATPVLATRTWGVPEILCRPELGLMADERNPETFSRLMEQAFATSWIGQDLVAYAAKHTWDAVAEGLERHFREILASRQAAAALPA